MKTVLVVLALGVGAICLLASIASHPAWAEPQREGMTWEQLAAAKPPAPPEVSVAVLPFWARSESQVEVARGCILLNLQRHGFKIMPVEPSLRVAVEKTDVAVKADQEREPGARIERKDALRLGKALGAKWVIYGELEKLDTSMQRRIFRTRKVGSIDIRVVIVDVSSGDILYWTRVRDSGSGGTGFWAAKAESVERHLATRTVNLIFDDIAKALPEHKVGPEVTEEQVLEFVGAMGK